MHWWGAGLSNLPVSRRVYRTNLGLPSAPDGGTHFGSPGSLFGSPGSLSGLFPSDRPEVPIVLFGGAWKLYYGPRPPPSDLRPWWNGPVQPAINVCPPPFLGGLSFLSTRFQSPLILLAREGVLKRQFHLQGVYGIEYTEGTKRDRPNAVAGDKVPTAPIDASVHT
jgi:hypothetical protein